jgi:DNA polymerase I
MEQSQQRLFLIDALSMIYRAYYALNKNPIVNSKGLNTSAILGFVNILTELLKSEKPTHLSVAFDSAAPTFRHEEYVEYKAQRQAMPEEIVLALPYIHKILNLMGIPVFMIDGFEADDIIGTLAKRASEKGMKVFMMTSDKDFGQLVDKNTFIYKPGKFGNPAEVLGVKEVCEKYEISKPELLIDILGLWGDASDNIPGIPGIGEVKAKKLVQEFGTIESLIERSDDIENAKIRELVKQYADQAIFSKKLATIETEIQLEFNPEKLQWKLRDPVPLMELFKELEFRTFSKRFFETFYTDQPQIQVPAHGLQISMFDDVSGQHESVSIRVQSFDPSKVKYQVVTTTDQFAGLMDTLNKASVFSFDTETTGLNPFEHHIIGLSFCVKEGKAFYLPVCGEYFSLKDVQPFLQQIFDNEDSVKIAHNLKFDMRMLKKSGIRIKGRMFDTMIANYLLNPEGRHGLDFLAETLLGYKTIAFSDLIPEKNPSPDDILNVPLSKMCDYACEDADITFRLYNLLKGKLKAENMEILFWDIEMPLIEVLVAMEEEGIAINTAELEIFSQELSSRIEGVEKKIFELSGVTFNLSSPKQLGEVLFDTLKITEKPPKTKTKQYATGEDILQKFVSHHPVVPLILEHRTLMKLKSTYVDALPKYIEPVTGRIHTVFNQTVTATGRLSSSQPNIQNIPIRTELGQEIRKAFIPRNNDFIIVSADYSQIELRIIAALSKEEAMIDAFRNGLDIHTATAARIYNISLEEVTADLRRNAKTVNFGIIYGISAFGLSERLGISRKESEVLIEEYFKKYPEIKNFMNSTIEFAKKTGYVETIKNRKRYISNMNSSNAFVRGFAERTAINAPVQGSAADIIKIAMIRVYNKLKQLNFKSRLLLQVHDELVFDVYKPELEKLKLLVEAEMKAAFDLNVIVVVDVNHGANWLDAH